MAVQAVKLHPVRSAYPVLYLSEQTMTTQPVAPAPAPDTATVLAGLVAEMASLNRRRRLAGYYEHARGVRECIAFVEAAQAASGARAAGDSEQAYTRLLDTIRRVTTDLDEEAVECIADATMEAAEADRKVECPYGGCPSSFRGQTAEIQLIKHWRHHAAPPTPSAPGVAELLAEARRRVGADGLTFTPQQIVRLLAPSGADGTEEGT